MVGIALNNPKILANVGSVLRSIECFNANLLVIKGKRYKQQGTDVFKSHRRIPVQYTENLIDNIPYGCTPIAVEFIQTATNLVNYKHPKNAYYIFGPEDGTLEDKILKQCKDIIYIPTSKCLNLAMATNIILWDRFLKQEQQKVING